MFWALTVLAQTTLSAVCLVSRQHARVLDFGGLAHGHTLTLPLLVEHRDHEEAEDVAADHRREDAQRAP